MRKKNFVAAACLAGLASVSPKSTGASEVFLKGLDGCITYSVAVDGPDGATYGLTTGGEDYLVLALWHEGAMIMAVENSRTREREIVYRDGTLQVPLSSDKVLPRIGFGEEAERQDNVYLLGSHDFTGDGEPELVLAVQDGYGLAIFVLVHSAEGWRSIGEIVTKGRGLGGARAFRQTLTLKNAETGTLYIWTCHNGRFDFLASDRSTDPDLF